MSLPYSHHTGNINVIEDTINVMVNIFPGARFHDVKEEIRVEEGEEERKEEEENREPNIMAHIKVAKMSPKGSSTSSGLMDEG
ncbi:hypothetical protein B7494_g2728 [Chlorociboria aeruginascens]|nr:hypothetical protein B7494_g2728 [Chlorociboria aeruginascens]